MNLIERIEENYCNAGKVEVLFPELDKDPGDATVYFPPVTVADEEKASELVKDAGSNLEFHVQLIIIKAVNSKGEKVFKQTDKIALMTKTKSSYISRMIHAMGADSVEKKKENSTETSEPEIDTE